VITRKPRKGDVLAYNALYKGSPTTYVVAETPNGDEAICKICDPIKGNPNVPQTWSSFIWTFADGPNTQFTIVEPTTPPPSPPDTRT
jgi:hypothetical protein